MENLETQQRVIELGRALVKEFNVEPGVDTLTRWIAHYIAELINKIEVSEEEVKGELQRQCFEAILTLWEHRSFYRDGHRPFESFEPIFRVLDSLNPENGYFYLRGMANHQKTKRNTPDEVQDWIDLITRIDELARIFMSYSLQKAASHAAKGKTLEWLHKSMSLVQDDDLEIIIKLVGESTIEEDPIKTGANREKELRSKLVKLNEFTRISDQISKSILNELEAVSKATK